METRTFHYGLDPSNPLRQPYMPMPDPGTGELVVNPVEVYDGSTLISTYMYDPKDRLLFDDTVAQSVHQFQYSYDSLDNILTSNESGTNTTFTYNAASMLTTSIAGAVTTTYTLDANGSQTVANAAGTLTTMAYDFERRMVSSTAGATSTALTYGPEGYKRSTTASGVTTTIIWDGFDILQERSPGVTNLITVNSQILSLNDANLNQFDFVVDQLGSVNGLMDLYAETFARWRWTPYGRFLNDAYSKDFIFNYGWGGSWGYMATGLSFAEWYMRSRAYSIKTSQWSTVDPIWPQQHPYGYAFANPLSNSDPSGLAVDCSNERREKISRFCQQCRTHGSKRYCMRLCNEAVKEYVDCCLHNKCGPPTIRPGFSTGCDNMARHWGDRFTSSGTVNLSWRGECYTCCKDIFEPAPVRWPLAICKNTYYKVTLNCLESCDEGNFNAGGDISDLLEQRLKETVGWRGL